MINILKVSNLCCSPFFASATLLMEQLFLQTQAKGN